MAPWRTAGADCSVIRNRTLAYDMRVGGVRVANIELRVRCTAALVYVEMEAVNRGLAAFFAGRNRTTMTAFVGFDEDGQPVPNRFRASYQKPDRLRETQLRFAPDGSLSRLVTYNQGRVQESPVPRALRQPSIDPLATLLQLSHWLGRDPVTEERLVYPVFEGRKRADLEVIFKGPATVSLGDREHDALRLEVALRGLAGFDDGDAFVTMPGDAPNWIDVYATREPMPVPLLIRSDSIRLPARIQLAS